MNNIIMTIERFTAGSCNTGNINQEMLKTDDIWSETFENVTCGSGDDGLEFIYGEKTFDELFEIFNRWHMKIYNQQLNSNWLTQMKLNPNHTEILN